MWLTGIPNRRVRVRSVSARLDFETNEAEVQNHHCRGAEVA